MAFCSSKDGKAQYIKSENIFLKPKPVEDDENYESVDASKSESKQEIDNFIDPAGLLIFATDMNDEQKVSLFTDLTEKLFLRSTTTEAFSEEDALELATTSKQLIDMIPAAVFETKEAKTLVYTQMANMVKH